MQINPSGEAVVQTGVCAAGHNAAACSGAGRFDEAAAIAPACSGLSVSRGGRNLTGVNGENCE